MLDYTFIAISDVHLGSKLYNIPDLEIDLRDIFVRICDEAIQRKVTYLIIVGDLFDNNKPTPDLIAFVRTQVARLKLAGITTTGIAGDHDKVVNGDTWVSVCNITPLSNIKYFAGVDFNDQPATFFEHFRMKENKEDVHWLLAHGQEVSMFSFVADKKRLEFTQFPVFAYYPNIKGILLGDIHSPLEGTLAENDKEIFMGYCGSPGYVKSDEYGTKKGILYFDGDRLTRLPIFPERIFRKVDFTGTHADPSMLIQLIEGEFQGQTKKPVLIIEHDKISKPRLKELAPLYKLAFVRTILKPMAGEKPVINIRSELASSSRFAEVLHEMVDGDELALCLGLLDAVEPRTVLDDFRNKHLVI